MHCSLAFRLRMAHRPKLHLFNTFCRIFNFLQFYFQTKLAVMNGLLQWIAISIVIVGIDGAIVPPPWSDPQKNPCANMPGGWQLLYWAPLKQCFKIFTVITTRLLNHNYLHFNGAHSDKIYLSYIIRSGIHVLIRWN